MNNCFSVWCKSHNLKDKNESNIYFIAVLGFVMKILIGNVNNKLLRQNAPMFRVLTSFVLKGIEWGSRKYMSTKIPGMVQQGLLVPQGLVGLYCVQWMVKIELALNAPIATKVVCFLVCCLLPYLIRQLCKAVICSRRLQQTTFSDASVFLVL